MARVLIVYYSFTHQTERAATCLEKTFIEDGWEARTCRLDFAGEAPEFPLRPLLKRAGELGLPSLRERPVPVRFDESVLDQEWDLVVIGSPTWVFSPAQPVSSFLHTPAATQLLSGRPFAVFVVCRGFWRRNLARVRTLGQRAGGRFVAGAGFGFDGNYLQTNHSFFAYFVSGGDGNARLAGRVATPYGLSEATLERVRGFGRRLSSAAVP
ncbi:MAG: flavodoxin family protein [Acidimicrobiia bacterium]